MGTAERIAGLVLVTGVVVGATAPARAQSAGLLAAYSFNEGAGTTVGDASGNGLGGTVQGATWTSGGKYGGALSFNGWSSFVDLGNPALFQRTGSITLEAWINAAASPPDDGQIINKSDGPGWQLKTSPDTGVHTFGAKVSASASVHAWRYSSTVRALNTWYHVASVYDAATSTLNIYVNGVLNNGTLLGSVASSMVDRPVNVNVGRRAGGYYFNGVIDEVRIYGRALSAAEIQSDMNTPIGGSAPPPPPPPVDTTPPLVSISSPSAGATLTTSTVITASASDNVGVAGVKLLVDGAQLGAELTSPPYSATWNAPGSGAGPHTLTAIARDAAGNTTLSSSVSVTVSTATAAQVGQWSGVQPWPIVAVHAALLPTGNVIAWTDYTVNEGAQLWRPATNTFVPKTYSTTSLFCAGHSYLADGRLFVAGGIVGLVDDLGPRESTIFDHTTESWVGKASMAYGRYYPTTTTLGDGRVLVLGGTTTCRTCIAELPEIYNPTTDSWTTLPESARMAFLYYPHAYLLPDGRVIVTSQDDSAIRSKVLNLSTNTWTNVDSGVFDGHSSAMYLPGKFMKAGTATADAPGLQAAPTTYVLDMTQPSPAWQATASMAFARSYVNLTILPDGQVLATGGGTVTDKADYSHAVMEAELWSPTTKAWTTMAPAQRPRLYHSSALLLPDGRVLVAGGGRQNGRSQPDPKDQANVEIFSPPYLFKGARPTITSAPAVLPYGGAFSVVTPNAASIASVSLVALGAVTHSINMSQRFVPLSFSAAGGSLNVTGPANGNLAPPGPYMLFIVDNTGVPSVAAMVRMATAAEDTQAPSAPANLAASVNLSVVGLTWTAATDNVGVTSYNVHRSTTFGFVPSAGNRIGGSSTTTYTDNSLSATGTYYYVVTAQDARGNVGAPSNQATAVVVGDTTKPTVSMTTPLSGATVSGAVTVSASASDNVGVVGVQFLLDGAALGAEQTGAGPTYAVTWSSGGTANGAHTLTARARDAAGNTTTSTGVTVTVSNAAPPGGLVAAYSFNEGSGATTADKSGNGLTGTLNVTTWTTAGRYGNGLVFNGASSSVNLGDPAALQLTGSMTLEAWVNAAANPGDDGFIVGKSDGPGWQLKTTRDNGPQQFCTKVSESTTLAARKFSTTTRALATWYHVAAVYDATARTLQLYVNGVAENGVSVGTVPPVQFNRAVNVYIGRRHDGFFFNGTIDEVRIYSRALSAAEINTDMNTPLP
jgi:hypothetical protein